VRRLLLTANIPSSPVVTLKIGALSCSETPVFTTATRRNISEDAILHSHCRENLKSYTGPFFRQRGCPTSEIGQGPTVQKIFSWVPNGCLKPRQTERLTACRNNIDFDFELVVFREVELA
jgi:hypothetical protein